MRGSVVSLVLIGSLAAACADDSAATGPSTTSDGFESQHASESDSQSPSESETGDASETETGDVPLEPICATDLDTTVTADAIAAHLLALDAIAAENDGNRSAGSSGYEASAAYVEAKLQEAGYATTRWPFSFDRYVEFSPSQLSQLGDPPTAYVDTVDFRTPSWSPSGNVAAAITAVDLELGLGNQSTSGCEPEDFAGFTAGDVALIQRGGCTFALKAQNAEDAGAVGVLIFNQGDSEDRLGLFSGTLGRANGLSVPVLFTTYALGTELADAASLATVIVELNIDAGTVATDTFNVLAETPTGDPEHVVMLGAHLDSVPAGPGVNDNGSGTATVLELALQFAACSPNNKVRFAWWGGEEWGLHGSRQWVEARSDTELSELALYLNFDMLASPNYVRYVHNGNGGPEGSVQLYEAFLEWYDAHELATAGAGFAGNSDYQPFVDAGVPSSGLATGAGGAKTDDQAATYGGEAGAAYDSCYHQACDDKQNVDAEVLGQNAQATAYVLQKWATDLGPLAVAPDIVTVPTDVAAAPVHECGHAHE